MLMVARCKALGLATSLLSEEITSTSNRLSVTDKLLGKLPGLPAHSIL
jgi:hypothetical protein